MLGVRIARSGSAHPLGAIRLDWCEGTILTPDGPFQPRWESNGDTIAYRVKVPVGDQAEVTGDGRKRPIVR